MGNLKAFFTQFVSVIVFFSLFGEKKALGQGPTLQFQDLAIILPPSQDPAVTIAMQNSAHWKPVWSQEIETSFLKTSVGNALSAENEPKDWRLVAIRIVPCQPFGTVLAADTNVYCWPEIRLVWQPIIFGLHFSGRNTTQFADDRAIHVIYRPKVSGATTEFKTIFDKFEAVSKGSNFVPTSSDFVTFKKMQNTLSKLLIQSALELRDPSVKETSLSVKAERAETLDNSTQNVFFSKTNIFLNKWLGGQLPIALTAFSLPEGRDAPMLDEWVFVSFEVNQKGNLTLAPEAIHSTKDGRPLVRMPNPSIGSQLREDPSLYDWISATTSDAADSAEVIASSLIWTKNDPTVKKLVVDRTKILVPNTTCASCHKLSDTKFNFHNLSYFEDQSVNISPRTENDVKLDLKWVQEYLK